MDYKLKDKVVLITGGSRGIGLELARKYLEQEAKVVICARKQEGLDAAQKELGNSGRVLTVAAHIAKEDDVEKLFTTVRENFPRLDILVNNVGMNLPAPSTHGAEFPLWQKIIDSNLNGTYLASRKAAEIMKEQKRGKIVSISSIAAQKASPGMGIYGIAKAAIEMMTRVLASELAFFNIQVNAVAPSMVRTDFSKPFWSNDEIHDMVVKSIPMGRIAEPVDVAHPVLFLSSEGSDFITGQVLAVDGGASVI